MQNKNILNGKQANIIVKKNPFLSLFVTILKIRKILQSDNTNS